MSNRHPVVTFALPNAFFWALYQVDMGDKSKLFQERSFWGAGIQLQSSIFIQRIGILFRKLIRTPLLYLIILFTLVCTVDALSSSLLLTTMSSLRCFLAFLYLLPTNHCFHSSPTPRRLSHPSKLCVTSP